MRVLWTLPYLPWPTTSGGKSRQYHLLRSLAQRGHQITLLVQSKIPPSEAARQALEPLLERLIVLPRRPLHSPLNVLAALYVGYPMRASVNGLAPHLRHCFEHLLDEHWDVIQIEHSYSFQPFEKALQARGLPFVLSEHTIESTAGDACHDRLPLWLRPFNAFDRWRYRHWERRVLSQADEVVAVSPIDAEHISHLTSNPASLVINGVDCTHFRDIHPSPHSQRLLFVGNFEHGASLEAIEWALEDILPQVWQSNPAVRLAVVGYGLPESWKSRWTDPRIEWVGYLPDLRELQRHSAIFFAPLRYGGGSKIKVLEAMAAGLPVVTTLKGVSGLQVALGEHYLGSDDPDQLALLITQLLNQPWRMRQLSEAARQFVNDRHDWSIAAAQLENVHARLSQRAPACEQPSSDGLLSRSAE
ncbi:glycosyltransferase family 4 protein [Pseudomonas sp. GD03860]|uniref:glycosyltransferase family 4 protein n=1 Tax=Pseudomonas TaxID=286 RepID=UPI002364324D|nr:MULTISPECIES: glycosyltransferase family 4 protein [Pseudomonas]MDD2056186.1 glycosyltransferase family 4 protein [Pseudomonas putida]MDH0637381.1 glycosyltransferase family 4 protein [Pseudomonas sp. GD03860]